MTKSPDDRSSMALAMGWAYRAIAVAIEMVVPGLVGIWLDNLLGTWIVFAVIGFGLGLTLAIWQLVRMGDADARSATRSGGDRGPQSPPAAGKRPHGGSGPPP